MGERIEAILRIPLAFLYGVIAGIWGFVAGVATVIHWFYTIVAGKRHKGIAGFTNRYITYLYTVYRYLWLTTNERAWPFGERGPSELEPVKMGR
jgi:hypothetical protein